MPRAPISRAAAAAATVALVFLSAAAAATAAIDRLADFMIIYKRKAACTSTEEIFYILAREGKKSLRERRFSRG